MEATEIRGFTIPLRGDERAFLGAIRPTPSQEIEFFAGNTAESVANNVITGEDQMEEQEQRALRVLNERQMEIQDAQAKTSAGGHFFNSEFSRNSRHYVDGVGAQKVKAREIDRKKRRQKQKMRSDLHVYDDSSNDEKEKQKTGRDDGGMRRSRNSFQRNSSDLGNVSRSYRKDGGGSSSGREAGSKNHRSSRNTKRNNTESTRGLLPFQSVLDVMNKHSANNSGGEVEGEGEGKSISIDASPLFEDILRPCLKRLAMHMIDTTEKSELRGTSASVSSAGGDATVPKSQSSSHQELPVDWDNVLSSTLFPSTVDDRSDLDGHRAYVAAKLSELFGGLTKKEEKEDESSTNLERSHPTNSFNSGSHANTYNSQTVKNIMMVLVTTLIALDLCSDGKATKQLAGDIVRETMRQVGRHEFNTS